MRTIISYLKKFSENILKKRAFTTFANGVNDVFEQYKEKKEYNGWKKPKK